MKRGEGKEKGSYDNKGHHKLASNKRRKLGGRKRERLSKEEGHYHKQDTSGGCMTMVVIGIFR